MSLSCSCGEWDGSPGTWAYFPPSDFIVLSTKRGRRCSSCAGLIKVGDQCLKFHRLRAPYTEIEEKIRGEEVQMSPLYMCEECGEIYLNLDDLGYCIAPNEHLPELLEEYQEMTGFKKETK